MEHRENQGSGNRNQNNSNQQQDTRGNKHFGTKKVFHGKKGFVKKAHQKIDQHNTFNTQDDDENLDNSYGNMVYFVQQFKQQQTNQYKQKNLQHRNINQNKIKYEVKQSREHQNEPKKTNTNNQYQKFVTPDDLRQIIAIESIDDTINYFLDHSEFFTALENTNSKNNFQFLQLLFTIIEKISKTLQNNVPARLLIQKLLKSEKIQNTLKLFQINILEEYQKITNLDPWKDLFNNILSTYQQFIEYFHSDIKLLQIDSLKNTLFILTELDKQTFEHQFLIIQNLEKEKQQIQVKIILQEKQKKEVKDKMQKEFKENIYYDVELNFREQNIFPTTEELIGALEQKNLRPNKIKGDYISEEFYLQNQFYLLREDFFIDFRQCVKQLYKYGIENIDHNVHQNCYMYNNCQLKEIIFKDTGMYFLLELRPMFMSKKRKVNWEQQKRLIHGSFLVITNLSGNQRMNFIYFAIVKEKALGRKFDRINDKFQKYGTIDVLVKVEESQIQSFDNLKTDLYNNDLFIIESKSYFESYYYFLVKLQNSQIENIPFTEHLIYAEKEIKMPRYLQRIPNPEYKFDLIFNKKIGFTNTLKILEEWPQHLKGSLDDSQYRALKQILTKKISLIQGPPGTGKTYVGAMAVNILLQNKNMYRNRKADRLQIKYEKSPILIICQTNHALDQFLRHIMKFTESIIRLGGRCSDPELEKFNITCKRTKISLPEIGILNDRLIPKLERYISQISQNKIYKGFYQDCKQVIPQFMDMFDEQIASFISYLYQNQLENQKNHEIQQIQYKTDQKLQNNQQDNQYLIQNETNQIKLLEKNYSKMLKKGLEYINNNLLVSKKDLIQKIFEQVIMQGYQIPIEIYTSKNKFFQIFIQIVPKNVQNQQVQYQIKQKINNYEDDVPDQYQDEFGDEIEDEDQILDRQMIDDDGDNVNELLNQYANYRDKFIIKQNYQQNTEQLAKQYFQILNSINSHHPFYLYSDNDFQVIRSYAQSLIQNKNLDNFQQLYDKFKNTITELENKRIRRDISDMKKVNIIGMTLTGCAKYSKHFELLQSKIAIIEEASECLEAQVFSVLSQDLEHLIMIGDHQQLRPTVNNFKLKNKYNSDVSLFERFILNDIEYVRLKQQRRMRPMFADFIRLIYNDYEDHEDVKKYEDIRGIKGNYLFIDYEGHYDNTNPNSTTKLNEYEGDYLVELAQYLILQDYSPEQITIVSMYVGQTLSIRKKLKQLKIYNVHTVTVDNYQGEESDIILLSLVRSNQEGKLGFASVINRINVAFSRAKYGFYVIGNFQFIETCEKQKELQKKQQFNQQYNNIWQLFINLAREKQILQKQITLSCQKHSFNTTINTPKDFMNVPEGGCKEICNIRMDCGHQCEKFCHNFEHKKEQCRKQCQIVYVKCGHKCKKLCREDCGNCDEIIDKILLCGHQKQQTYCFIPLAEEKCYIICKKQMMCGHECQSLCHLLKNNLCNVKKCEINVQRVLLCGHQQMVPCNLNPDEFPCQEECKQILDCGHICQGDCNKCLNGTLHIDCNQKCTKQYICGHPCKQLCKRPCVICRNKCQYQCCKAKCDKICGEQCIPCNNQCKYKCEHSKCQKLCKEQCDRQPCNLPCLKPLKCQWNKSQDDTIDPSQLHHCIGLCGEECIDKCRVCDKDDQIFQIFFGTEEQDSFYYKLQCSHIFEVKGLDQYMQQQNDSKQSVNYKTCPNCRSKITQSSRYANIIKNIKQDIIQVNNLIKSKNEINQQQKKNLIEKIKLIQSQFLSKKNNSFDTKSFNCLKQSFIKFIDILSKKKDLYQYEFMQLESIINLIQTLIDTKEKLNQIETDIQNKNLVGIHRKLFNQQLKKLEQYLINDDYWDKLNYSESFIKRLIEKYNSMELYIKITLIMNAQLNQKDCSLRIIQSQLFDQFFIVKDNIQYKAYQDIIKQSKLLILKDQQTIIKAIGLEPGHWFKCQNGHFYAIGECGGAMEKSHCPECGDQIGGLQHQLVQGNQHAGELDGSQYASWSDQANMNNVLAIQQIQNEDIIQ